MSLNNWMLEQIGPAVGLNGSQAPSESSGSLVYLLQIASNNLGSEYLLTLIAVGAIVGSLGLVSAVGLHIFFSSSASSLQKRDIALAVLPGAYVFVALLASAAALLSTGFDFLMPVLLTMVVFLAVDAFYVQLPRLRSMRAVPANNGNGTATIVGREIVQLVGGHALQIALILIVTKRLLLV